MRQRDCLKKLSGTILIPKDIIQTGLQKLGMEAAKSIEGLHSSSWANVFKVKMTSGTTLVAKVSNPEFQFITKEEARMLGFLNKLPGNRFPKVVGATDNLMFLGFIENDGSKGKLGAAETGRALAELHNSGEDYYGFPHDTIFGCSPQPNPKTMNWVDFFGTHRLLYMGRIALNAGQISGSLFQSLENFAQDLENFLPANPQPALLHGDFWGGNILYNCGRLAAFIDPAIYYGDQEVDLAFATLFGAPGPGFFDAYREIRAIDPGFEERIDIYNLWGLLFHAYWFGGGYVNQVKQILCKFGF